MAIANQALIASLNHPPIPSILPGEANTGLHVIKVVESARKAKAPIVGIPIPGERPFTLKREMLKESLRGMRITEASIQRALPGSNAKPYLLVFAETDNGIKGSRKYLPLDMPIWDVRQKLDKWAESQRTKRAEPKYKGKAAKL